MSYTKNLNGYNEERGYEKAVYCYPPGQTGRGGPDSNAFKPYTMKYRGREQVIHPSLTVEDYRQGYENKWRELEPVLRAYYKENP